MAKTPKNNGVGVLQFFTAMFSKNKEKKDNNVLKTSSIRLMKVDVDYIIKNAKSTDVKNAFTKLSEELQYSDPIGCDGLSTIESDMMSLITSAKILSAEEEAPDEFRKSEINNGEYVEKKKKSEELCDLAREISILLAERNQKCRELK